MPSSHPRTIHDQSTAGHASAPPRAPRVSSTIWAPAHLDDLTGQLSPELVDEALDATGARERRTRYLPSRGVVHFVLALALFPELGYRSVFGKLCGAPGHRGAGRHLCQRVDPGTPQDRHCAAAGDLRAAARPCPESPGEGSWFDVLRI